MLQKILLLFKRKEKKFFPLFSDITKKLVEMATLLNQAQLKPMSERVDIFKKIGELKDQIEDLVHEISLELSSNFITPFDREDIHALSKSLNNVSGYIHSASNKMYLYKVDRIIKSIHKLTSSTLEACILIDISISDLMDINKHSSIAIACRRIAKIERKSDDVYEKSLHNIFVGNRNTKDIIKYKEVLSALENATDKCKGVANTIEVIIVKNS